MNSFLPIALLLLLTKASNADQYVAPSTLLKFRPVLLRAKLQSPVSERAVRNLIGYSSQSFHLTDDNYIQFQMNKKGQRSELRQNWTTGSLAAWQPSESCRAMHANVALPAPEDGVVEFTFMQVHCTRKPLLRLAWQETFEGNRDVILAVVRKGLGDDDLQRFPIGRRSDSVIPFRVLITKKKLSIWMDKKKVMSEKDVSFFKDDPCYFKAGVYINQERKESAIATTLFRDLDWWC